MSLPLEGRHVVVTGAGRGLGRGMALAIAAAGATVTLAARSREQLAETADLIGRGGGAARVAELDVADTPGLDEWIGSVDEEQPVFGIVHAAGVQLRAPAVEITAEQWRGVLAVNVDAPFLLSTALGRRQLAEGRGGSHVFVSSLSSAIGLPGASPYTASKSAVAGTVRVLATEWARSGIRVNAVLPGYFHTELTAPLLHQPEQSARLLSRIPMGRFGDAAELGGPAVFLLSDAASYVTGHQLAVDGGWLAN